MGNFDVTAVALTPTIGAIIDGVSLRDVCRDDVLFAQIRSLWLEHLVLFFPKQSLDHVSHLALGERFGPLHIHPAAPFVAGNPALMKIHSDHTSHRNNGDVWHSDVSADEVPPMASILHLHTVPESGGDTLWANMYDVFESLSESMQNFLRTLEAYHASNYGGFYGDHKPQRVAPAATHPVVRTHPETGREALYVNRGFTDKIHGLAPAESAMLLEFLFGLVEQPRFHCRYRWSQGDVAIWDNRCTQHHAIWDYFPETRSGVRVTIAGDRPKLDP